MNRIPEDDWKVFKKHHLIAHEAYCQAINSEVAKLNEATDLSIINKFQSIAKLIDKSAKKESELFLDYRRSTALLYLLGFINEGLLNTEQVAEYSEEVIKYLNT